MKYPVELIQWNDHSSLHGNRGWRDLEDAEGLLPQQVSSVGWIVKETNDFIVLVSQEGGDQVDGEVCIIKTCITRRLVLLKDSE